MKKEHATSDELAAERTLMAAGRTLLAWVRTSTSVISFGFTIFKVLQYVQEVEPAKLMRPRTPRNIGIFMLLAGTIPLFLAIAQYRQTVVQLTGSKTKVFLHPGFLVAIAVAVLGVLLLLTILLNIPLL